MKTIGRLYQYFEFKGIKPTRFEKDFNISNGYFGIQKKRNADIGSGIIELIVDNCRDLNVIWLLTGRENMIISPSEQTPSKQNETYCEITENEIITHLRKEINEHKKAIEIKEAAIKILNGK